MAKRFVLKVQSSEIYVFFFYLRPFSCDKSFFPVILKDCHISDYRSAQIDNEASAMKCQEMLPKFMLLFFCCAVRLLQLVSG